MLVYCKMTGGQYFHQYTCNIWNLLIFEMEVSGTTASEKEELRHHHQNAKMWGERKYTKTGACKITCDGRG